MTDQIFWKGRYVRATFLPNGRLLLTSLVNRASVAIEPDETAAFLTSAVSRRQRERTWAMRQMIKRLCQEEYADEEDLFQLLVIAQWERKHGPRIPERPEP